MDQCPPIAKQAQAGQLVWQLNHDVTFGHSTWNTDLAIGPPGPAGIALNAEAIGGMARGTPVAVRVAVEHKAVMTEHGKARKNRMRDLEAHHAHVHDHDNKAIAAGLFVVNAAETFRSPLRPAGIITKHHDPMRLVENTLNELLSVSMAGGTNPVGLDAKGALVVVMDNVDWPATRYLTTPPAPQPGQPIHWDSFVARICDLYARRFA